MHQKKIGPLFFIYNENDNENDNFSTDSQLCFIDIFSKTPEQPLATQHNNH